MSFRNINLLFILLYFLTNKWSCNNNSAYCLFNNIISIGVGQVNQMKNDIVYFSQKFVLQICICAVKY